MAVTTLNPGEFSHRWPQVLPGSQAILFTASTQIGNYDDANIDVISVKTGQRKTIVRGGFSAVYVPTSTGTGHVIYVHQSTLFAVPFDPGRLTATGSPVPILEEVSSSNPAAGGEFAFAGGVFVYLSTSGQSAGWPISLVDRSGKTDAPHAPRGIYLTPRFSPDGKRLAFEIGDGRGGGDLWVKDLERDTPSRLSFLGGASRWPVWTPDGKNIVFQSTDLAAPGLYCVRSDGAGEVRRLTDGQLQETPGSFSPDGKRLAFWAKADIFTASVESDPAGGGGVRLGKAELFLGTPSIETNPEFSPDGRWLAYQSGERGNFDVYVRPFPGPGGRWQISTGGGTNPRWSRDGRELLFQSSDNRVMVVRYTTQGDSFAPGKPEAWTAVRLYGTPLYPDYDLAPDGKRIAAHLAEGVNGEKSSTHLTFLLNFSDELRRRAPVTK